MRKWFILMAVLAILTLALSACGGGDTNGNTGNTGDTGEDTGTAKKVVTISWTQEPDSLNPLYSSMLYSVALLQVWNCWAWQYDVSNTAYPLLVEEIPSAENGGVSEDGLTITLQLRDDINWSDGTPITSEDFLFTYQMITDEANLVDSMYPYDYLEAIETPDPQTVVMKFSEPFAPWEATFWHEVLPKHILQPVYDSEGSIEEADWNNSPSVGCGPFVFDEWSSGSYLSFVRNENYFGDPAILDQVIFMIVPDDAAQTAAILAEDADIAYWPPYEDIPKFEEAGLTVLTEPAGYNEAWFFNLREMSSEYIHDLNVRKAIAMAINRNQNAKDLQLGIVKPNLTFWDALPEYVSPNIEPWPFDPQGARDLLESAGYIDTDNDGIREDANGNDLTITQGNTTKEIRQSLQAVIQQQLLEVGIKLDIFAYDADILFESYTNDGPAAIGALDVFEWSDVSYFPDPDINYWLCSEVPTDDYPWGCNYFVCDETLDSLFQEQLITVDKGERIQIFHEISEYMHDNVYYLGIWEDPDIWIINPRVLNTKFSGVTMFFNINEWDVTD